MAGGKILVLDDDTDVLTSARLALAPHVGVVETDVSIAGLEARLAAGAYDALLMDMNFAAGQRSGREGLKALASAHASDSNLSIVMMTAYGGVSLAVDALKQGAADFILNPWRNEKLIEAVAAAIALTSARRGAEGIDLDTLERNAITRALARRDGNISLAASDLGLSRPALYRRMAKYGL